MRAALATLLAAAALATAGPAAARHPGEPQCGDSPAAAARWAKRELRVAQRAFPKHRLKLLTPTSCFCRPREPVCTRRRTELDSLALALPAVHTDLVVWPAVLRLRPPPEARAAAASQRRPPPLPERVLVVPFASVAAAADTIARIRQQPLALAAFGRETPLFCVAFPGFTYSCTSAPWSAAARARELAPQITLAETPPGSGAPEQPLRPTTYRLPARVLPPDAPHWRVARRDARVGQFVAAHPEAVVELLSGARPVLLLRVRPGSDEGLAVRFREDAQGATVVDQVTPGAKRPAP